MPYNFTTLQAKMIFLIYHNYNLLGSSKCNPEPPQKDTRSYWKKYILLWKNEIYSGKHLEKSWKNDPERLCEPCTRSNGPFSKIDLVQISQNVNLH